MTDPTSDTPTAHAYVVDDDAALRAELAETLAAAGLQVRTFPDGRAFLHEQATLPEGCLVLDVHMPGLSGREVQDELRRTGSHHQIVMLTGAATVPLAVEALHATGSALGHSGTVATLLDALAGDHATPGEPAERGRALDEYIEVQVHGPVRLACDVEALVADPAFRETAIGVCLAETSARYGLTLAWHRGFAVEAACVPPDFRGPRVAALAARLARSLRTETLDAAHLGEAARSVVTAPEPWSDWGTAEATLQELKQLWHVLVRHGGPARTPTEGS
jgi:CheY-like chemotaxis protein